MGLFGSRDGWVYCLRASDGALAWRFKDLPDRLIGAYGQLESKWPVAGSVIMLKDTLFFAAGRSTFLDGGVFLYALDPRTGKLLKSRSFYGPFEKDTGFPATNALLMHVTAVGDVGNGEIMSFNNLVLPTLAVGAGNLYVRLKSSTLSVPGTQIQMINSTQPTLGPTLSDPPNQQLVNGAIILWQTP